MYSPITDKAMEEMKSVQEGVQEGIPLSQEEFEKHLLSSIHLTTFEGVRKYKSVKRAIKRGHVTRYGILIPSRPFNNRKPTRGRKLNEEKKRVYKQMKDYERRHGHLYTGGF